MKSKYLNSKMIVIMFNIYLFSVIKLAEKTFSILLIYSLLLHSFSKKEFKKTPLEDNSGMFLILSFSALERKDC